MTENKKTTSVTFVCDCHCSEIRISKMEDGDGAYPDEYYFEFFVNAFYANQPNSWDRFKMKLKFLWRIITRGEFCFYSMCINKEEFNRLCDGINKMQKGE